MPEHQSKYVRSSKTGNLAKGERSTSKPFFQAKLTIGPVDDVYEREADAMADRIMKMPATPAITPEKNATSPAIRKCSCEKDEVKRKGLVDAPQASLGIKGDQSSYAGTEDKSRQHHSLSSLAKRQSQGSTQSEVGGVVQRKSLSSTFTKKSKLPVPSSTHGVSKTSGARKEELQRKEMREEKANVSSMAHEFTAADGRNEGVSAYHTSDHTFFLSNSNNVSRKCKACEEEDLQRKEKGSGVNSPDSVPPVVNSALKSEGHSMDATTRTFMEDRFGHDFSQVKIHTGTLAERSAQSINALAYTSGNSVVFNAGQYAPDTKGGKKLLAHELTHVIQQTSPVRRKPKAKMDSEAATILNFVTPSGDIQKDIKFIKEALPEIKKTMILQGSILMVYKIDGNKPIQLDAFTIKNTIVLIPCYHWWGGDGLYYPFVYEAVTGKIGIAGKQATLTPEQKKAQKEVDAMYDTTTWFLSPADKTKFYKWFDISDGDTGVGLIVMPPAKAAKEGGSSGEGGSSTPPKPSWSKAFEKAMKELIAKKRAEEPSSEDIPEVFNFYYSKHSSKWRGYAAQKNENKEAVNKVYTDVQESDKPEAVLELLRQKIRIEKLKGVRDTKPSNDATALKEAFLWAYELKLKLEKIFAEENKKKSNLWDLPDKLSLTTLKDDDTNIYLQVHVYAQEKNELGKDELKMKAGVLPDPLRKGMTPDQLIPIIKKATRILKGENVRWDGKKKSSHQYIKEAYPAVIIPHNVRDDARTVTGAEHEFTMKMDLVSLEGKDQLHLVTLNMRTVYYFWDIYRVEDQLSKEERERLGTSWKERKVQLAEHFKTSGHFKTAPLVNRKNLQSINDALRKIGQDEITIDDKITRDRIEELKSMGVIYGSRVRITPGAEFTLPSEAGDYIIYCRAQVEPTDDTYIMPSEAVFPIRVEDGYKLARETTDKPLTDISDLKKELETTQDKNDQDALKKRIKDLETRQALPLKDRTTADIKDSDESIRLARKLKDVYLTTKGTDTPFALVLESDHDDGKQLLDLWTMLELHDRSLPLDQRIDQLITNLEAQKKELGNLHSRINLFKDNINQSGPIYTPSLTLVSKETGQEYQLITMLGEDTDQETLAGVKVDGITKVVLVDVTTSKTQKQYRGYSVNPDKKLAWQEAAQMAFAEFGRECEYGRGYLAYRVPGLDISGTLYSKPGIKQQIISILETVAAVAGIAALVLGSIATGGALAVAAVALGVGSAVVGGALAARNIYDRYENHRLELDVELALDVLNIIGPMLTALNAATKLGKAAALSKGALTLEGISKINKLIKLEKGFAFVQKLELATNFYLLNHKVVKDINEIQNANLTPAQKDAIMRQIMLNALMANVMIAVAVRNEIKARVSPDEAALNKLLANKADELRYRQSLQKAGLVDTEGNWTIKELNESAAKIAAEEATPVKTQPDATPPKVKPEEPYVKPTGKSKADPYEKGREVDMTGHAKSPDKKHEVEGYPDGTFGRCSPANAGEKCPLLHIVFKPVLDERPVLKQQLDELMTRIRNKGEHVPQSMLDELGALEMRMRNIETAQGNSSAPKDYKVKEIGYRDSPDLPLIKDKTVLEYPNGERVWRGPDNKIHHEGPIGPSIGRKGTEREKYSGGKTGLSGMKDYERAHSVGQGFGWESPFAILYAPRYVNQTLQNNGIEQFVRSLRDVLPPDQKLVVHTATKAIPDTLRLQSMSYEGFIVTATGEKVKVFSYDINVSGTREKPVIDARPIQFAPAAKLSDKSIIDGVKSLIPAADMPAPITKSVHHEGF